MSTYINRYLSCYVAGVTVIECIVFSGVYGVQSGVYVLDKYMICTGILRIVIIMYSVLNITLFKGVL